MKDYDPPKVGNIRSDNFMLKEKILIEEKQERGIETEGGGATDNVYVILGNKIYKKH